MNTPTRKKSLRIMMGARRNASQGEWYQTIDQATADTKDASAFINRVRGDAPVKKAPINTSTAGSSRAHVFFVSVAKFSDSNKRHPDVSYAYDSRRCGTFESHGKKEISRDLRSTYTLLGLKHKCINCHLATSKS